MGIYRPVVNIVGAAAKLSASDNGNAPHLAARAWVHFNGTGTVAIQGSANVSSITDNGVGNYTANFTTAMPDINFCVQVTTQDDATAATRTGGGGPVGTGGAIVFTKVGTALTDRAGVHVAIFR